MIYPMVHLVMNTKDYLIDVDELERENRNRKRDAQMRSLGTDDFYRQNLPFDPGF